MQVGSNRGIQAEMNVVPLIDILLVLLVIFMIIPTSQKGLDAAIPRPPADRSGAPEPEGLVVIEVKSGGELRINQQPIGWDRLGSRLEAIFKSRMGKVAFIRGEAPVEFQNIARVIDVMSGSGISAGLLTPGLEQNR
jgi:biopolymer transport protein TolR